MTRTLALLAIAVFALSCEKAPVEQPRPPAAPVRLFDAQRTSNRFLVADHMLAGIEMQISGEPFVELLGRDLAGFDRFNAKTDLFFDPETGVPHTDLLGFSMAVESYEYSKQPMNQLSFETGAGISLMYGPLLNPLQVTGDPGFDLLADRFGHLGEAAHATGLPGLNLIVFPRPLDNPLNVYGWPGYWPVVAEYRSFDPTIHPTLGATRGCTFEGGYAAAGTNQVVGDYECGYNSLNLPDRDKQIEKVLAPDAMGYATWKQILWVINYWATLHDLDANFIIDVDPADMPMVGVPGNNVVGRYADPNDPTGMRLLPGGEGVYLGDVTIEGWQGQVMLDEMDNKAALLLGRLTTGDGTGLGGFASVKEALDYDWESPLRWFPAAVRVTEETTAPSPDLAGKYFPRPTSFTIEDGQSRVRDLSGLIGGFASFFAITDARNPEIGGLVSSRCTYDGDPFPADNGLPDGEASPHDRSLAVVKAAMVNLDRLHFDPVHKVLADTARPGARGARVTTVDAAYAIFALRTGYRALVGALSLYGNDTPDQLNVRTLLDQTRMRSAPATLDRRLLDLVRAEADFIADKLVDAGGAVANGYDLQADARDPAPTRIEAQAGALRGLLEAYLMTNDRKYLDRGVLVYEDLDRRFWMEDVRAYRTVVGESDRLVWTGLAFGVLEGALRQFWKLYARNPGQERLADELLARLVRTFKLVVNGWDDTNGDEKVDWPAECTGAGLQMGERALTGEMSRVTDQGDRDRDCVPDISAAKQPAALAAEIVLTRRK